MAQYGGLADDDAGAVVDAEVFTDGSSGVDVNSGLAMDVFGHDAGDDGHAQLVQTVSQPVGQDGIEAGVGDDDFLLAGGGRVAVVDGLNVGQKNSLDLRQHAYVVINDGIDVDVPARQGIRRGHLVPELFSGQIKDLPGIRQRTEMKVIRKQQCLQQLQSPDRQFPIRQSVLVIVFVQFVQFSKNFFVHVITFFRCFHYSFHP